MLSNYFTTSFQNFHTFYASDDNSVDIADLVVELKDDIYTPNALEREAIELVRTHRRKKTFWNIIRVIGDFIYKSSTGRCFASSETLAKQVSTYQDPISSKRFYNTLVENKELRRLLIITTEQTNDRGHWSTVERRLTDLGKAVYSVLINQGVDKMRSKRTRCANPGHGKTKPGTQSIPTHDHRSCKINYEKDIKAGPPVDKPDGVTHDSPPSQAKSVFCEEAGSARGEKVNESYIAKHARPGETFEQAKFRIERQAQNKAREQKYGCQSKQPIYSNLRPQVPPSRNPEAHQRATQRVRDHFKSICQTTTGEVTEVYNLYYAAELRKLKSGYAASN